MCLPAVSHFHVLHTKNNKTSDWPIQTYLSHKISEFIGGRQKQNYKFDEW